MPGQFRPASAASSPADPTASFIAEFIEVWPDVTTFEMFRLPRSGRGDGEPIGGIYDIVHVGGDDDPRPDAEMAIAKCREDAKVRGQSSRYIIYVRGNRPGPILPKGKGKSEPLKDQQLATWAYRFGEDDPHMMPQGTEASTVKAQTEFMRSIPDIYRDGLAHVEGALRIGAVQNVAMATELERVRADNERLRAQVSEQSEWKFRTEVVKLQADAIERAETREEAAAIADRAHAEEIAKMRHTEHMTILNMAGAILPIMASGYFADKQMKRDPPKVSQPKATDLVEDLNAFLQGLGEEKTGKLREAFGADIWNPIVDAANADDNESCIAAMMSIKQAIVSKPQIVAQLLAGTVIIGPEATPKLMQILARAGVYNPAGSSEETKAK